MANKPVKHSDRDKPWNRKKIFVKPYAVESVSKGKSYLVVCEGKNTEKWYLMSLPAPNADIVVEGGYGSKTALVRKALQLRKRSEYIGREVWCVYDMDYKGDQVGQRQDFNASIELARRNGMKVAYSNDAFELWFVLHYQVVEQAFLRFDYYRILTELWGLDDYEEEGKKLDFSKHIYDRLASDPLADQLKAIQRAKMLLEVHSLQPFADQNPCTTVFELIEALIFGEVD